MKKIPKGSSLWISIIPNYNSFIDLEELALSAAEGFQAMMLEIAWKPLGRNKKKNRGIQWRVPLYCR